MRSIAVALVLCALGCGGAKEEAAPAQTPKATSAQAGASGAQPLFAMAIRRSLVRSVVKEGLGAFLQRVSVDSPVFLAGKFHGFRLASVPKDWSSVDLRAGDVITSVNGFSVERPETAYEAFRSLEVASELRVDYERDGEPRALRLAIVDD
jgi:type II secretory pathway component PulC